MKPALDYGASLINALITADAIYQAMFSTDASGPTTLKGKFKGLRFADTFERFFLYCNQQFPYFPNYILVMVKPITKVLPGVFCKLKNHGRTLIGSQSKFKLPHFALIHLVKRFR